jgi:RNA polymerase sigma-70 factor (ECF subfamily)
MASARDDWAIWLDEHGPALVLFARHWASNQADAEDIVQEAFVHFWRSRERAFDPAAYLYTCVKRCALDWQRGRKRQLKREAMAARPESEAMFGGSVEQEERRGAISAALGTLPPNQREVLVMKIWGGLSYTQIGKVLGIPDNTAASRYRYALARLREQLAEETIP